MHEFSLCFFIVLHCRTKDVMASFYPDLYQAALSLLVEAREKAGLSQADLAQRFGLGESFVASYEDGARLLDPAEYVAICRAIGVDPYELLAKAESENGGTPRG
jgi:ribosome-binding protein aMBF1 (putative translation factor)